MWNIALAWLILAHGSGDATAATLPDTLLSDTTAKRAAPDPQVAAELKRLQDRLDPKDAEAHFQLALCAEHNGLRREYARLLSKTIDIDPYHVPARAKRGPMTVWSMPKPVGACKATRIPAPTWTPPLGFSPYGVLELHELTLGAEADLGAGGSAQLVTDRRASGPRLLLAGDLPTREKLGAHARGDWLPLALVTPGAVTPLASAGAPTAYRIDLPADPALSAFPYLYLQVIEARGGLVLTSNGLQWVIPW